MSGTFAVTNSADKLEANPVSAANGKIGCHGDNHMTFRSHLQYQMAPDYRKSILFINMYYFTLKSIIFQHDLLKWMVVQPGSQMFAFVSRLYCYGSKSAKSADYP